MDYQAFGLPHFSVKNHIGFQVVRRRKLSKRDKAEKFFHDKLRKKSMHSNIKDYADDSPSAADYKLT